jgi:RimJ/RimL family protein N-acetyltransferase
MSTNPGSEIEVLSDGSRVIVRPIDSDDVELERRFITELSPESRRFRFLATINQPSEGLLRLLTNIDPSRDAALGALDASAERLVGVARFSSGPGGTAEVAVTVSDDWQHRGLGSVLARRLIDLARRRGIRQFYSIDSDGNRAMHRLAKKLGFDHRTDPDDATQVIYTLDLHSGI